MAKDDQTRSKEEYNLPVVGGILESFSNVVLKSVESESINQITISVLLLFNFILQSNRMHLYYFACCV